MFTLGLALTFSKPNQHSLEVYWLDTVCGPTTAGGVRFNEFLACSAKRGFLQAGVSVAPGPSSGNVSSSDIIERALLKGVFLT